MRFKTSTTTNRVQLIRYRHLGRATTAQCAALRAEAARCWSDLVAAHSAHREQGRWLTDRDLRT